jgi:lipopolysaccharide transport system ATP-binding protein
MSAPAVAVKGVWKDYVLGGGAPSGTLYDALTSSLRWRCGAAATRRERIWALKDVEFHLRPGEVVGVIGRNGAGKSTLLKILSRITAPTRGRIEVRGRLTSLLEVGTGFHPELSGRENIFLNGAILGMKRHEVARKLDAIVAFAEIDKFADTPVKRYSSGMYVRLAFAVAAHLETDVLLVDEVLAVGDASFQRKSLGKMGDAARSGRTVLFVSHNLGVVRNLCSRALLFEGGHLVFSEGVNEGLARYERTFSAGGLADQVHFQGTLRNDLRFTALVCRQRGDTVTKLNPLHPFELELRGEALRNFPALELKVALFRDGLHIGSCHDTGEAAGMRQGLFVSRFRIPGDVFKPGRYTIGVGATAGCGAWVWGGDVAALDFSENTGGRSADRNAGIVSIPCEAMRSQPADAPDPSLTNAYQFQCDLQA